MSGTSADGGNAATTHGARRDDRLAARLEAFRSVAYTPAVTRRLLAAADGTAVGVAEVAVLRRRAHHAR